MSNPSLAKGSFFILFGNIIFRVGGYVYRFMMTNLLGPAMYGILGLTLPLQGIFQILAAGGLPPAIAKYVAEYKALNNEDMARQTILTALKTMIILGLLMGFLMVFIVGPYIANEVWRNPDALLPLQTVGLITPFSVIVGAYRGAFQGVYKMEYIVATRAVEQIVMILCASGFILIGLQATGGVLGSVVGFMASASTGYIIYKKYMGNFIQKKRSENFNFTRRDELKLAKQLIFFSIPVTITALAEMVIYSISTIIMGVFLTNNLIGYFTAADPIARLPLTISISIATTILPAASAAYSTKNKELLDKYVFKSYEYSLIFTVPLCIFISVFAGPIMRLVYFTNSAYSCGAPALSILVIGMTFYSIYGVSTGIVQGIGYPKITMYILVLGSALNVVLNWFFIQAIGINGGAIATTITTIILTIPSIYYTLKKTEAKIEKIKIMNIIISSLIMGGIIYLLPSNIYGLLIGVIISPIIYFISLLILKVFDENDVKTLKDFENKTGPLKGIYVKMIRLIEKRV